jgi:hypothetical protein
MPSFLFFAVTWAGMAPEQALERALDAAEPPPAMRAAFHATLTAGNAIRRIEYDPYADNPGQQFKVTYSYGDNDELDAVVEGWRDDGQADSRLFADDLRLSLADARIAGPAESMAVSFRHRMSNNDGPVDQEFSANMAGRLQLDPATGYLSQIDYNIDRPVKLDDGKTIEKYQQTYHFGYSERWGVSYVTAYELTARGSQWGLSEERSVRVTLTDIAFGYAGDSRQDLVSRPAPSATLTAKLQ